MAIVVKMVIITTITKQPEARREVKWLMFSFGLYVGNEQNKQEMRQLWTHMPCATEQNPL